MCTHESYTCTHILTCQTYLSVLIMKPRQFLVLQNVFTPLACIILLSGLGRGGGWGWGAVLQMDDVECIKRLLI